MMSAGEMAVTMPLEPFPEAAMESPLLDNYATVMRQVAAQAEPVAVPADTDLSDVESMAICLVGAEVDFTWAAAKEWWVTATADQRSRYMRMGAVAIDHYGYLPSRPKIDLDKQLGAIMAKRQAEDAAAGIVDFQAPPPAILGWTPPLIYDIGIDQRRIATQEDVDKMAAVNNAYGALRTAMKKEHDALRARIGLPPDAAA